jgi:hypothetical protein
VVRAHRFQVVRMDGSLVFLLGDFAFDTLLADVLAWEQTQSIPLTNGGTTKVSMMFHWHFGREFSWMFTRDGCEPEPALYAYQFEDGDCFYIIAQDGGMADGGFLKSIIQSSFVRMYIGAQMGRYTKSHLAGLSPERRHELIESLREEACKRIREDPSPLRFRVPILEMILQ